MSAERAENERWGRFTEWAGRLAFSLTADRGTYHDARDADGRPVEIKACQLRIERGDPGKWFVREANHERLRDADGLYAFAVYDPLNWTRGPVLKLELKPSEWLDEVPYAWTGNGARRGEIVKRPPWTSLWDPADVPGASERDEDGAVADAVET